MTINLIPDIECNLDIANTDLMGTKPYVEVLEKIIYNNKHKSPPLTIGLFGGWGSGKSSIIKTLFERLKKNYSSHNIKTVIYDAWKYSGDAFRRSFILELKAQLALDWDDGLRIFYSDKDEEVSTRIDIKKDLWKFWPIYLPLFGLLIIFANSDAMSKGIVMWLSIIVSVALAIIRDASTEHKVSVTTPKIFSPEQFKGVFDQAIEDVTGEKKSSVIRWWKDKVLKNSCNKVVIVIDNVDRCDKKTSQELLLNIKTYLEKTNCIVIVPIDDGAIKSHLEYIGDDETNEFLRKLFNVSIRIKELENADRYDFTKELIRKHSLGFSNEVASVISQEFAKNPRRIIQFLNNLSLEREIAEEQEKNGLIPNGSISKHIDFLAKILLIKEEYPILYKGLVFDSSNLFAWEKLYELNLPNQAKEIKALKMFMGRTSGLLPPNNIAPFFFLRAEEESIPLRLLALLKRGIRKD